MSMYLSINEFETLTGRTADAHTEILIQQASEQIDTLTFQRIKYITFANLTNLQKDLIKAVCAGHIAFLSDYGDMLDSPLNSYSIAGVSMHWSDTGTVRISGIVMQKRLYDMLLQTGLCNRTLR